MESNCTPFGSADNVFVELNQPFAVGQFERRVPVPHQEIPVAAAFANQLHQPARLFDAVGIGMDEDRAVLEPFGGGEIQIGHIAPVQFAFGVLHLHPLVIIPV